jgi:hypothetical protein
MADLFKRTEVEFGGAFHAQKGLLLPVRWQGGRAEPIDPLGFIRPLQPAGNVLIDVGALMQNLSLQYQQSVNRVYEIGMAQQTTKVYYIAGRASGNISTGHIVGPSIVMTDFYEKFSDVCNLNTNTLSLSLGPNMCDANGEELLNGKNVLNYGAKFCLLTAIGMGVTANDFLINTSSQIMFSGLEFTKGFRAP